MNAPCLALLWALGTGASPTPPVAAPPTPPWRQGAAPAWPAELGQARGPTGLGLAFGVASLLLALGGLSLWLQRQRQAGGGSGNAIELVAVRALGSKHRLALVEICGERLLLATNEREITLLSHLPQAEAAGALPAAAAPAPGPARATSRDVAGLLDLAQGSAEGRP